MNKPEAASGVLRVLKTLVFQNPLADIFSLTKITFI